MPRSIWIPVAILLGSAAATVTASAAAAGEVREQIAESLEGGAGELQTFPVEDAPAPLARDGAFASRSAVTAFSSAETVGEQRTLVTLVNFTNDPSTPFLAADIEAEILDETNPGSTAAYVLEASYGRAWLTGSVLGWVSASYADSSCFVAQPAGTQQLVDELDPLVDWSQVDRWIVVIPRNPSCGFVGYSTLGKWTLDSDEGTVQMSRGIVNVTSLPIAALVSHEMGHGFAGLQHSADHECGPAAVVGTGCNETGTDRYDLMAASASGGHFTPPSKAALGWLGAELTDVAAPGGTYLLEPYEAVGSGTGTKVLRIPVPWPVNDYREARHYTVSYRKPIGLDAPFSELAVDGAMLNLDSHYFPEYSSEALGASQLLDAKPSATSQEMDSADVLLEVGQTFVDAEHGIEIETLSVSGGLLEVSVTIDQYCGNGVRDAAIGEICDGSDLGGATCSSIGRTSGTLGCTASCEYDTSACGAPQCNAGDGFDEANQLCIASLASVAPVDMGYYRNAPDWSSARNSTVATLLTKSRGFMNASQSTRSILWRLSLPFDTSVLPDGAAIDSASLKLKQDAFPTTLGNSHPDSADQLVLIETTIPDPTTRALADFGQFGPVDAPDEGAPRIDVSESLVPNGPVTFDLNATGLSWIDDQGLTRLGLRFGYDVDDVTIPGEDVDLRVNFVPPDSPIAGPRLEVKYQALPEPGVGTGLLAGIGLLIGLVRRRR